MTCVFSIAALVLLSNEDRAQDWGEGGSVASVIKISIGNYGAHYKYYEDTELIVWAYLNFGAILIILFLTNLLKRRQLKLEKLIDEKNLTPADFTVYVMGLPLDKTKQEVIEWFKEYDPTLEIAKVNYCYDIKEIVKKLRKLDKWQKMKNYVEQYRERKCKEHGVTETQAREQGIEIDPPRVDYDY